MYLMTNFTERARNLATFRAIRKTPDRDRAHRLILDALPPVVSRALTPAEVETMRQRLNQDPEPPRFVSLRGEDFGGAAGVFLLVFLSTFPIALPFLFIHDTAPALKLSNAIAIAMLFVTGWSLGRYAGRPGWRTGLAMVTVGVVLIGTTMALGG